MISVSQVIQKYVRVGSVVDVTELNALDRLNDYYREYFIGDSQSLSDIEDSVLIPLEGNIDLYTIPDVYSSIFVKEILTADINSGLVSVNSFTSDSYIRTKTTTSVQNSTILTGETVKEITLLGGVARGTLSLNLSYNNGDVEQFVMRNTTNSITTLLCTNNVTPIGSVTVNFKTQILTVTLLAPEAEDVLIYYHYTQTGFGFPASIFIEDKGLFQDDALGRVFRRYIILDRPPSLVENLQTLKLVFKGTPLLKENDEMSVFLADILIYGSIYQRVVESDDNGLIATYFLKLKTAKATYDRKKVKDYMSQSHQRSF